MNSPLLRPAVRDISSVIHSSCVCVAEAVAESLQLA
jgi:hypothetical protein